MTNSLQYANILIAWLRLARQWLLWLEVLMGNVFKKCPKNKFIKI